MLSIEQIVERDRREFNKWVRSSAIRGSLNLPYKASRFFTIPLPALRISSDPYSVDVLEDVKSDDYLSFLIYEPTNTDHSHDYFHREFTRVLKGDLQPTDLVYLRVGMDVQASDHLHVIQYEDAEEFRNRGVATSFYRRLRYCAAMMGFRMITGLNDSPRNFEFFKKMGRFTINQFVPRLRKELQFCYQDYEDLSMFTVDLLDPRDISKYVIDQ